MTNLGISALFVGTFLATPYAFFYDTPSLTIAILAVMHDQAKTHRLLPIPDAMILGLALLLRALMMEARLFAPGTSIPLILLFGLIVRRIFGGLPVIAGTGAVPPKECVGTR